MMTRSLATLAALVLLTACAAEKPENAQAPTERQFVDLQHQQFAEQQFAIDDAMEGTNKYMYKFNAELDRWVLIPIVDTYTYLTPEFLRDRVQRFFLNFGEITNFTNALFQASPGKAATTLGRFAINSTVGVLGLFEVAEEFGLERQPEDFGQTLGYWGVGPGTYVVLPFFGPSNVRDTAGLIVDFATLYFVVPDNVQDDTVYKVGFYGVQPVNMRYSNKFRYFESGSPFEYEMVRYINTKSRELQIQK